MKKNGFLHHTGRFTLVTLGAALMAMNINTLVHSAGLLPGGFSGITLLIQEAFAKFLGISIPYSLFYWALNIVPAVICFKTVGKNFTLYSIYMIIISGLLTDFIPGMNITDDILLCAIFGGIINATAVSLCLFAGATSGGTDFISIYISQKTGKSAWGLIFGLNCIVLFIAGILFGWDRALYSIIFQYSSTQVLNLLYKRYNKTTLLIISEKHEDIYKQIKALTNHDATLFTGKGCYEGAERHMLYTVVSSEEASGLIKEIKKTDENAFINVLQTKDLMGRFFVKSRD